MLLNRTISQLAVGDVTPKQAQAMGHMGYIQWLGALNGNAAYVAEAERAYESARPFIDSSPAIAVFCNLLIASIETPLRPLALAMPPRVRRGGASARRAAL